MYKNLWLIWAFFMVACSGNADKKAVRLASWQSSPVETKLMDTLLHTFKTAKPEVPIKFELIPGNYPEKIQLMLGTNTAPHLFYMKDYLAPSMLQYDLIQPLTQTAAQDAAFEVNDIFPVFRNAFSKDGDLYGIPKDFSPMVLFYNKDMFAEAGITQAPQNWQELYDVAKALTKPADKDGKVEQFGLVIDPAIDKLLAFVMQNGGEFHNENRELKLSSPEFVGATEFYLKLYRDGIATIPTDLSMQNADEAFSRKRAAMVISGGWFVPQLRENYPDIDFGIDYLPMGKKRATLLFTVAYCSPKGKANAEGAWKLMSYLTGKEGMKQWTSSGFAMPTRKSVAEDLGYYDHPTYKYFMGSVDFGHVLQIEYNERWFDICNAGLQAMFYNKANVSETLTRMEGEIRQYPLKSR